MRHVQAHKANNTISSMTRPAPNTMTVFLRIQVLSMSPCAVIEDLTSMQMEVCSR